MPYGKNGQEDYVLIASNGTPIAKVIPVENTKRKFGCCELPISSKKDQWVFCQKLI